MSAERDVAHWLEARPLDREHATSTVVFPSPPDKHVTAKVLANQTELVASISREALAQHLALA